MGNSGEIQVLDATQAVRMRPAMFVGDTNDGTGLAHLVWEVLSNVLDQHLRGEAQRVRIEVFADGVIEIEDDGAGISLCSVRCDGRPMLEDMLVTLYCGPISNMRQLHFHPSSGRSSFNLTPVSAVCAFFEIETTCMGERARVRTERGLLTEPAHSLGACTKRGSLVRFRPDETIFSSPLTPGLLAARLEEIAWTHPLLEITWQGREIHSRGGFAAWTRARALGGLEDDFVFAARTSFGENLLVSPSEKNFVDLAFGWERDARPPSNERYDMGMRSFVNSNRTEAGTHIDGLLEGLSQVAKDLGVEATKKTYAGRLVGAVHVILHHPEFGAPTRDLLVTPLAGKLVREVVQSRLPQAMASHPEAKARLVARGKTT